MTPPADTLFHVADAGEWAEAERAGTYERSTRDTSLQEGGFIHLSTATQWRGVLDRFYGDHVGGLLLLEIDPGLLDAPLRYEVGDPTTGEEFPHLYGPLPVGAVVGVTTLRHPGEPTEGSGPTA